MGREAHCPGAGEPGVTLGYELVPVPCKLFPVQHVCSLHCVYTFPLVCLFPHLSVTQPDFLEYLACVS